MVEIVRNMYVWNFWGSPNEFMTQIATENYVLKVIP